jgi:hypothetical protein
MALQAHVACIALVGSALLGSCRLPAAGAQDEVWCFFQNLVSAYVLQLVVVHMRCDLQPCGRCMLLCIVCGMWWWSGILDLACTTSFTLALQACTSATAPSSQLQVLLCLSGYCGVTCYMFDAGDCLCGVLHQRACFPLAAFLASCDLRHMACGLMRKGGEDSGWVPEHYQSSGLRVLDMEGGGRCRRVDMRLLNSLGACRQPNLGVSCVWQLCCMH